MELILKTLTYQPQPCVLEFRTAFYDAFVKIILLCVFAVLYVYVHAEIFVLFLSQAMWLTFSCKKLPQSFVFKLLHLHEKINHFSLFAFSYYLLKSNNVIFTGSLSDFLFVFCLMLAGEGNDEFAEHIWRVVWRLS